MSDEQAPQEVKNLVLQPYKHIGNVPQIPDLHQAQRTLDRVAPVKEPVADPNAAYYEQLATDLAKWQQEQIIALVGPEVFNEAEKGDLKARLHIKGLGLFLRSKKKIKGNGVQLIYILCRHLKESNRIKEVARFKFHFEPNPNYIPPTDEHPQSV